MACDDSLLYIYRLRSSLRGDASFSSPVLGTLVAVMTFVEFSFSFSSTTARAARNMFVRDVPAPAMTR